MTIHYEERFFFIFKKEAIKLSAIFNILLINTKDIRKRK